jgi:hypothetical protein
MRQLQLAACRWPVELLPSQGANRHRGTGPIESFVNANI